MADRDSILEKHFPTPAGSEDAQAIKDAMDEYMEDTCLELLEYMAKNKVECGVGANNNMFWYKGECLTRDQLFENFL